MLYFIIAVLIVVLDQLFKYWIILNLSSGGQISLIPGIIHLTYEENTGAAFSIFQDMRWVLVGIAAVCIIVVIIIMIKYRMRPLGLFSLAGVLGGAVGNGIDRALHGYVVDMFEVEFMRFAIFNIADIFITVGGIVFCLYYIAGAGSKSEKIKKQQKSEGSISSVEEPEENWTETKILEDYELERLLSEDDSGNKKS